MKLTRSAMVEAARTLQLMRVLSGPGDARVRTRKCCKAVIALVAIATLVVSCATVSRPSSNSAGLSEIRRTPVEVWRGGDDGYTVRFGEALEEALEDSLELSRVTTRTPGALRLTIETNLHPLGTGDNPKAAYVV